MDAVRETNAEEESSQDQGSPTRGLDSMILDDQTKGAAGAIERMNAGNADLGDLLLVFEEAERKEENGEQAPEEEGQHLQ